MLLWTCTQEQAHQPHCSGKAVWTAFNLSSALIHQCVLTLFIWLASQGAKSPHAVFPMHVAHSHTNRLTYCRSKETPPPGMLWAIIGREAGGVKAGIITSYSPVQHFNLCYPLRCISGHLYNDKPWCLNVEFTTSCGAWIVMEWKELWTPTATPSLLQLLIWALSFFHSHVACVFTL